MFNPNNIEMLESTNAEENLAPEFIEEFSSGKGDDEDGSNTEIHE